jgi:hypothetical protein
MDDWRQEIVKGVLVRRRLRELDTKRIWKYYLPEVAASEDEIAAAEEELGFHLGESYHRFLRYANGWRSFWQNVDILGTSGLLGGPVMGAAREHLAEIEPELFAGDVGLEIKDVLPIAASTEQDDVFLLGLPWSKEPGVIIWFAGQLIERFPDFDEFYLSMLDYSRNRISKFETGWPNSKLRVVSLRFRGRLRRSRRGAGGAG